MSSTRKKHENETGHTSVRNEVYDAYYCKICNIWLEKQCTDKTCQFCSTRPVKPHL